ncbi:MAG: CoA transferase [Rhodospirillales bacterium]|nr:MAG: CoA transferase [Rhodospirillales bacterium]
MTADPSPAAPLAGLRVLDFGHTIMGPCAGVLFADLGADVVKIEPVDGDPTRRLPGFAGGFFATFNRNKRSVAVDLKKPEGVAVVHRLAAGADIVLENYGHGTIERLGCGWEDLEKVNPRLIYLALKGYLKGPYERRGALDEVVQMQSGLAYMTGPPGQPLRAGASIIDILGAVFGVVAAMAALRERDRTGRGQRVGGALFETAAFLMGSHIAGGAVTGQPMPPFPARKGAWGVYDVFTGADGTQVFVGLTSDGHWARFCATFGLDDLGADPRLRTNALRTTERAWLIPRLREVLGARSAADIVAGCAAADVPYARIGQPADLLDDAQLQVPGGLLATALSALGGGGGAVVGVPGLPVEFGDGRARAALTRQPPRIGEHGREILAEAGYTPAEIDALAAAGVLAA